MRRRKERKNEQDGGVKEKVEKIIDDSRKERKQK